MLNTKKLLYILPDVAYVAELLPAKKEHTFAIQSFRQINGEFMTEDTDFNAENVEKLLGKLEPDTYHLVLPDFLFTNTIVEVKETHETKVKNYIKDTLLPSLDLSRDSHEIETFVLTQYNNVSKIQLTALEKSVLAPIVSAAHANKVEFEGISPLTWTIKSVISLEPSISVIQIGSTLYVAEHYIGVDQCTMATVAEIENVGETIKTLKGSQPSIQTIYLLTNDLVEDQLKSLVSNTIPVQQLTSGETTDDQLPNYVKNIIESGMKTLDISDYPVPKFALPKANTSAVVAKNESDKEDMPKPTPIADLPTPVEETAAEEPATTKDSLFAENVDLDDDEEEDESSLPPLQPPAAVFTANKTISSDNLAVVPDETPTVSEMKVAMPEPVSIPHDELLAAPKPEVLLPPSVTPAVTTSVSRPSVIKNKGASSTAKMLLLMAGVFIVTVAAGIGIGLVVLKLSDSGNPSTISPLSSPLPSASPVVVASPSPSPASNASQSATIRQGKKLLVVNATTKAGYAGTIKTKLETGGFAGVKSANAKGDYEAGNYVLMAEKDQALIDAVAKDTGLEITYDADITSEDAKGEFDAVVVLNE